MPHLEPALQSVYDTVLQRNPGEVEFHQAVHEVLESLNLVAASTRSTPTAQIIERICEPERQIIFRVPWVDDRGEVQINRGFRVEFNSALGPYKGGLRFHPSVYLGHRQVPRLRADLQERADRHADRRRQGRLRLRPEGPVATARSCGSASRFMTELYRHLGEYTDVPAGDIGVGAREIGYLFGQYKRITNRYESGVLTGKGLAWGGAQVRTRGDRLRRGVLRRARCCSARRELRRQARRRLRLRQRRDLRDREGAAARRHGRRLLGLRRLRRRREGHRPRRCSRRSRRSSGPRIADYAERRGRRVDFVAGGTVWEVPCEVAMPCATQNELTGDDARDARRQRVLGRGRGRQHADHAGGGAGLPGGRGRCSRPGKAANAGGVATSALEMQQNASRDSWTFEHTERRLEEIMTDIHDRCAATAEEYGVPGNYVAGANIAGFIRVADAMLALGII